MPLTFFNLINFPKLVNTLKKNFVGGASPGSRVGPGEKLGQEERAGVGIQEPETECWQPTAPAQSTEPSTGEEKNLTQNGIVNRCKSEAKPLTKEIGELV